MNKTQKIIVITLGTLTIISIAATVAIFIITHQPKEPPVSNVPAKLDCPITSGVITYVGQTGKTVLDLLSTICEITTNETDTVTSIDGITAASPDYWALYINEEYALESPATLQTIETDTIRWQLETLGN